MPRLGRVGEGVMSSDVFRGGRTYDNVYFLWVRLV